MSAINYVDFISALRSGKTLVDKDGDTVLFDGRSYYHNLSARTSASGKPAKVRITKEIKFRFSHYGPWSIAGGQGPTVNTEIGQAEALLLIMRDGNRVVDALGVEWSRVDFEIDTDFFHPKRAPFKLKPAPRQLTAAEAVVECLINGQAVWDCEGTLWASADGDMAWADFHKYGPFTLEAP
jgi:hypothetical protein